MKVRIKVNNASNSEEFITDLKNKFINEENLYIDIGSVKYELCFNGVATEKIGKHGQRDFSCELVALRGEIEKNRSR